MKLSTKGEYGLLAIIDLALHSQQGPVQSLQIAERQGIPKQYLDQLMLILKKAGLVESSRGRQGGYLLSRSASSISVLEIVTALEGPIERISFQGRGTNSKSTTRQILRDLWDELYSHIIDVLQNRTLEEVCDRYKKLESQIMYYI